VSPPGRVAPWRMDIWSVIIGTECSVKHDTLQCRLCGEVSIIWLSFGSLFFKRYQRDNKFVPGSQRNTCCKHNHHEPAPVLATGVPPRARFKFWYLFWKRPHQKRIKWWHFSAESTMWSAMLYWKFSTNPIQIPILQGATVSTIHHIQLHLTIW